MIIKVVVVSSKGMPPVGDYSSGSPSKSRKVLSSSVTLDYLVLVVLVNNKIFSFYIFMISD